MLRLYTSRRWCLMIAAYSVCAISVVLSNEDITFSANITLTDCRCTCSRAPTTPTTTTAAPTAKTTSSPWEEDENSTIDSYSEEPKVMIKDDPFVINLPRPNEDDSDNEQPGSGDWEELTGHFSTLTPSVLGSHKRRELLDTQQPTAATTAKPSQVVTTPHLYDEREIFVSEPGPKGEKGDLGAAGPVGPEGSAGFPGDKGEKGDNGQRGEAGLKGDKGERGQSGQRGYPGTMGPQGYRGGEGPRGEAGTPGPRGQEGPRGPRGEQGTTGRKGSQGLPGPQGQAGPEGSPGKNAEVTERQKVAFLARLQDHYGPSSTSSHVIFPQVDFNLGKGYDPSSGSFLVTVDGLYVFHLQAMAMADYIAWLAIHVNGEPVAYLWASGYQSGVEQMGSTMTIQELKLGDVVHVVQKESGNPENYLYAHYTLLSGYLLG